MKVKYIVTRVKAAIDELRQEGTELLSASDDEKNLEQIIIDKIGYALQYVLENAPLEKLDSDSFEELTAEEKEGYRIDTSDSERLIAEVKLPADLLRIIEARLSSWSQSPSPESDTSQVYLMQQDKYACGSWDRPVTILTWHGSDRYLEMYCAKSADDKLNLTFIRKPQLDDIPADDGDYEVKVPSLLQSALVYHIAGLTMVAYREELSSTLFALSKRHLDGRESSEKPITS